jgi:hypothetical protein
MMSIARHRLHAVALAAALLAFAVPACSAQSSAPNDEWVMVHRGREARVFMDTSRVVASGPQRTVWLRTRYETPEPMPDDAGKVFWGVETGHRLNCAARTVTDLEMSLLDSAGATIETGPGTRWKTFDEHPFGEYIFPAVCRRLRT